MDTYMLMDCMPGFIHSGDDFVITDNGILITETTITGFNLFDSTGLPEFMRARKAAQYSNSIDDVTKTFTTGNNGGYANDWLIGDTKTNEVAKLELGLKDYHVWRSKDTAMIGSNFPSDPKLIKEETTFNVDDATTSPNARRKRMEQLVLVNLKGKLDAEVGKQVEADHVDALQNANANNRCVICGHIDEKMQKDAQNGVSLLITQWVLYREKLQRLNSQRTCSCGRTWDIPAAAILLARRFTKIHPEYAWQSKYLNNMMAYPWTLFSAKK